MATITNRLQAELISGFKERQRQAVSDARLLAENSGRVAKALRAVDPKLETAVRALIEFVEFQRAIQAEVQAIAGHAAEDDDLAQAHARDLAHVATLAINLPEVLADRLEFHAIDPADPATIARAVHLIGCEIEQAAQVGGALEVAVIIREAADGAD